MLLNAIRFKMLKLVVCVYSSSSIGGGGGGGVFSLLCSYACELS
jgi:hypothetical protein